jgi:hypothetical protein
MDNNTERYNKNEKLKSDKNLYLTRTYQVYKDLVELRSVNDIVKQYSSEWGVSDKNIYRYVTSAYEIFDNAMSREFDKLANKQIIRILNVGKIALQEGKLDTVLKSLDLINKTSGIYTDNLKIDANVHADGVIKVTFAGIDLTPEDELNTEISELENETNSNSSEEASSESIC